MKSLRKTHESDKCKPFKNFNAETELTANEYDYYDNLLNDNVQRNYLEHFEKIQVIYTEDENILKKLLIKIKKQ